MTVMIDIDELIKSLTDEQKEELVHKIMSSQGGKKAVRIHGTKKFSEMGKKGMEKRWAKYYAEKAKKEAEELKEKQNSEKSVEAK